MSVKIRMRRMGAKKRPFYRIVVADSRTARDGRFIEVLGFYNPLTEPPTIKVDEEKTKLWLSRGAQPSDTCGALLKKQGFTFGKAAKAAAAAAEAAPVVEEAPKKRTRKKAEAPAEES